MTKSSERLHFYLISMSLHFPNGSTAYRESQVSSTAQFIARGVIEKCKQDAIEGFCSAAYVHVQAISYLGFMTDAEFHDETLGFTSSN